MSFSFCATDWTNKNTNDENNNTWSWNNNWNNNDKEKNEKSMKSESKHRMKPIMNITFNDIALSARINKNATNLVYGYIHDNEKKVFVNQEKDEKIIPSEIKLIILAFFPAEIPFYDHLFEIQCIGHKQVSKTLLLSQHDNDKNNNDKNNNNKTKEKIIKINRNSKEDHEIVQLRLYDVDTNHLLTSSNHNISSTKNYFGDGIIIIFDITNRKTFEELNKLSLIQNENDQHDNDDIIKILVGNKYNDKERKVTHKEANEFAKQHQIEYIEISTKDDININQLFERIAIKIADKYDNNHQLFINQWKQYNKDNERKENDDDNDFDDADDNKQDDNNFGTKKFFENNDFVPYKQQDSNRSDRVYYYQNICLSNDLFNGKSPEELRFEDKYNEHSIKIKGNNKSKNDKSNDKNNKLMPSSSKSTSLSWSFDVNNTNHNNNTDRFNWAATNTLDTKPNLSTFSWSTNRKTDDKKDEKYDNDESENNDERMREPTEEEIMIYAKRLTDIYQIHNGDKVDNVPNLFNKYGKTLKEIDELYNRVCQKYNTKPKTMFISKEKDKSKIDKKYVNKMSIDEYIINEICMKCIVSKEIAQQALNSSLWDADIAINKINALKKFNCDLSIFESKQSETKQMKMNDVDRKPVNEEICVYQNRLKQIFKLYDSEKVEDVNNLINKQKDNLSSLHQLYFKICLQYKISPQPMFVSDNNGINMIKKEDIDSMKQEINTLKLTVKQLQDEKEQEIQAAIEQPITEQNAKCAYSLLFGS